MSENKNVTRKDLYEKLWKSRDFEISHLWQRSLFLATFIVLVFTVYFTLLGVVIEKADYIYEHRIIHLLPLRLDALVIAFRGDPCDAA